MKVVVFDGQLFQTKAWDRGMGRYSLQLLKSYVEQESSETKKIILFNKNIQVDPERSKFIQKLIPDITLVELSLPVPNEHFTNEVEYQDALNQAIEHEYAQEEVTFVLLSAFTFDHFANYPRGSKKVLVFYDLTPIMFWSDLGRLFPAHLYMKRFRRINEADAVCCISETVRRDLIDIIGIPKAKTFCIDGGFSKVTDNAQEPKGHTIPDDYVLLTSGDLPHKNNDIAVQGFELADIPTSMKLVVTSHFSDDSIRRLSSYSNRVIFTGNVSNDELLWLNEHAAAVIFPSKYEGLGMPILDAIDCKKPIVASDIPVFREMSSDAMYYFKTNDARSLAHSLEQALSGKDYAMKLDKYQGIMDKYNWTQAGKKFLAALAYAKVDPGIVADALKVAIVCPNPSVSTDMMQLEKIAYTLSREFQVSYFFDSRGETVDALKRRPSFLNFTTDCYDIMQLTPQKYCEYEKVIYILDAGSVMAMSGMVSLVLPGDVVLIHSSEKEYVIAAKKAGDILWSIDEQITPNVLQIKIEEVATKPISEGQMKVSDTLKHTKKTQYYDTLRTIMEAQS